MIKSMHVVLAATLTALALLLVSKDALAYSQSGIASYYWEPQMTASGERFNPNAMTAAHKTLPMGTRVKVTHVKSGRSVIVRINDRGPFVKGRIIDLSRAAAGALGIAGAGLGHVTLAVVGKGVGKVTRVAEGRRKPAKVHVASLKKRKATVTAAASMERRRPARAAVVALASTGPKSVLR